MSVDLTALTVDWYWGCKHINRATPFVFRTQCITSSPGTSTITKHLHTVYYHFKMQFKLLCAVALASSAFAEDSMVTGLNRISQAVQDVNQGLKDWQGDYSGAMGVISKGRNVVSAVTGFKPDTAGQPTDDVLQQRDEAVKSLAKAMDETTDSSIAAKARVERLAIPIKPIVAGVVKGAQSGFTALSKAYIATVPDEQKDMSQAVFDQINNSLEGCYNAYRS